MLVRNENDGFVKQSSDSVLNTMLTDKRRYIEQFLNPLRDIQVECGLPTTYEMDHRYFIEAICVELGIPVRIFKGSERGELNECERMLNASKK